MNQVRRDVQRLLSVPAPWILFAVDVAFAIAISLSMTVLHAGPSPSLSLGFAPAIAGLFGAVSAGADFRFGAVPGEILALGGPVRYLLRTLGSIFGVAAAGGATVAGATTLTWILTRHPAPSPGRVAALVLAGVVASACWAILGAVLAIATQGQIAAVASVAAYLMIVEPMLEVSARGIAPLLPGRAAVDLFSLESVPAVGAVLYRLVAPTAVLAVVACVLVRRRDVPVTTT